jgi:transposase
VLAAGADEPWVWALFERAPTPARGAQLKGTTLQTLLSDYRIRRLTGAEVQAVLRTPAVVVNSGTVAAAQAHAAQLVRRLHIARAQLRECAEAIARLLTVLETPPPGDDGPTDTAILHSMPGAGPLVVARVVSETPRPLAEATVHELRAWLGAAPVTKQSGKQRLVVMRRACAPVLRTAAFHWAQTAARVDAASARCYAALRARGHSHGRALRSVADRLLRILVAMLKRRTVYDPHRFAVAPPALITS